MATVYTIGYQGRELDAFAAALLAHGVGTLCDVRRKAMSRKRGFAKPALRTGVEAAGIAYVHLPDLGMPLDLFDDRNATDNSGILAEYRPRLETGPPALEPLEDLIRASPTCLMCVEADVQQCHRRVLAELVAPLVGAGIVHIEYLDQSSHHSTARKPYDNAR